MATPFFGGFVSFNKTTMSGIAKEGSIGIDKRSLLDDIEEPPADITFSEVRNEDLSYKDIPFSLLFIAVCVAYCVIWFTYTITIDVPAKGSLLSDAWSIYSLFIIVVLSCFTTVSITTLLLLKTSAYTAFMKSAFIINATIFGLISIYCFLNSTILYGFVMMFLSFSFLLYLKDSDTRFRRSSALLELVVDVFKNKAGFFIISTLGSFCSLAFSASWVVLFSNIYNFTMKYGGGLDYGSSSLLIFTLFSGFYISEVIRNITLVTLSGCYADWYFNDNLEKNSYFNSFKNAVTYKFGSISLGSLIVSSIEFTNQLIEVLRRINSDDHLMKLLLLIISSLLAVLESMLRYFNNYVFSFVAIFGDSFIKSSKKIIKIFQKDGWSLIINDCILTTTLKMFSLLIGMLTALICYLYLIFGQPEFNADNSFNIIYPVLGFIISNQLSLIFYTIISSGSNSLIIMISATPDILFTRKQSSYETFLDCWPELLKNHNNSNNNEINPANIV